MPDNMPDGRPWPRISIVTPSYNQGRFVEETIRSVLLQGYPNLEYIVMDGGSSDESVAIIEKYKAWLCHFSSERDSGQSDALNKGFKKTTGAVLGWLNSDDVLTQQAFSQLSRICGATFEQMAVFVGASEYRDVSGRDILFDVSVLPTDVKGLFAYPDGLYLAQPSVFFTRKAWVDAGGLDEKLHYAMDLDYWIRLARASNFWKIDAKLSWMRQHDDAKTWRDEKNVILEVEKVLASHSNLVTPQIFSSAMRSCRRRLAKASVRSSLCALSVGNRREAVHELKQSLRWDMLTIFNRGFIGVLIRLWMPIAIQRLILTNP